MRLLLKVRSGGLNREPHGVARFVIADLTDAKNVRQELEAIVPDLPSVALLLMIKKSTHEYGMPDKIRKYPWVIKDTYEYENADEVIDSITEGIIGPAEAKVKHCAKVIDRSGVIAAIRQRS
jgi:hypothetical protein